MIISNFHTCDRSGSVTDESTVLTVAEMEGQSLEFVSANVCSPYVSAAVLTFELGMPFLETEKRTLRRHDCCALHVCDNQYSSILVVPACRFDGARSRVEPSISSLQ